MVHSRFDLVIFYILPLFFPPLHKLDTEEAVGAERKTELSDSAVAPGDGDKSKVLHIEADVDWVFSLRFDSDNKRIP